jgi:hypothetical protein
MGGGTRRRLIRGPEFALPCPREAPVTTPEQLREVVRYLQNRVVQSPDDERVIVFDPPAAAEMVADGLDRATVDALMASPWWSEMMDDVVETPDFAGPDEAAEVVLGYARDVIEEYVRKRFPLQE